MKLLEDLHTKGTLYFSTHCCMSVKTRILLLGNIISIILDCFLNVGLFCKDDWYIFMHEPFHYLFFTNIPTKLCFFCYLAKEPNLTFCSMVGSLLFWERSAFYFWRNNPERCRLITLWWSFDIMITCTILILYFSAKTLLYVISLNLLCGKWRESEKNEKITQTWAYIFMDIRL